MPNWKQVVPGALTALVVSGSVSFFSLVFGTDKAVALQAQRSGTLAEDVSNIQHDLSVVKGDVTSLKVDVAGLKSDVSNIRERLDLQQESLGKQQELLLEILKRLPTKK